jgi:hypothetical protein
MYFKLNIPSWVLYSNKSARIHEPGSNISLFDALISPGSLILDLNPHLSGYALQRYFGEPMLRPKMRGYKTREQLAPPWEQWNKNLKQKATNMVLLCKCKISTPPNNHLPNRKIHTFETINLFGALVADEMYDSWMRRHSKTPHATAG